MQTDHKRKKISLPQVSMVSLRNFDLYTRKSDANVRIDRNVFCLIGANGLGKSTFLNTINFAVTGAIPDSGRKFQSAQDYYRNASRVDRTEDYFDGRISEENRPLVDATVELSWPTKIIRVTREIFNGSAISSLSIKDLVTGQENLYSPENSKNLSSLNELYEQEILAQTGLNDFPQFVFLLHFVATFDEGRHLLMWDDSALTNALYLAFGTDPIAAQAADKLQHDMERESSRARNIRFAARNVTERIEQLMQVLKGDEKEDHVTNTELQAQHEKLIATHSFAQERVRMKQSAVRDNDVKWTNLSSSLTELQIQYKKVFSSRLQNSTAAEHHPIIRATISEDRCAVCGTAHVGESVYEKLASHHCPLCDHVIEGATTDSTAIQELQVLDNQIILLRDELSAVLKIRERLIAELQAAESAEIAAESALNFFEEKEQKFLLKANVGGGYSAIKQEIEKLEQERNEFHEQSKDHYRRRDEIRARLHGFEKKLKAQYDSCAEIFVPRFRALAEEFIGLPVDVELEHRQGINVSGFGLRLKMNDQLRATPDTLSESQRFFIDIALRMALSEFMAENSATLLIDTPEGSLDIAYEARAGVMFSSFVANDNKLLMTANLRSSQLVLRLANLQREKGMQIVRMTDWTELSEVQQSEEQLFTKAYQEINEALG
jgi:DNA repair exonuclease SbcCD ATPase subunit